MAFLFIHCGYQPLKYNVRNIFFLPVRGRLPFILLIVSFTVPKLFSFMWLQLSIFAFVTYDFVSYPRNYQDLCQETFPVFFILGVYQVLYLSLQFIRVQFHYFYMWIPSFPKPFVNMNLESRHAYLEKDRDRNQKCHQNAHTSVTEDKQLVGFKFGLLKVFKIIHQWLSGMVCVAHRRYQFKQFQVFCSVLVLIMRLIVISQ